MEGCDALQRYSCSLPFKEPGLIIWFSQKTECLSVKQPWRCSRLLFQTYQRWSYTHQSGEINELRTASVGMCSLTCKLKTIHGNRKSSAPVHRPGHQKFPRKLMRGSRVCSILRPGATHLATWELEKLNPKKWLKVCPST